ncbi:MAG: hypothetical protein ACLUUO_07640 [Sellimonas intestinalis]
MQRCCGDDSLSDSGGGYAQICPEYTYEGETKEQMQRKINAETKAFLEQVQEIQSASEYDRIKYVYEYVIRTVDYVADASDSQNLFSALVGKESVCAGYARETSIFWRSSAYSAPSDRDDKGTAPCVESGTVRGQLLLCRYNMGDPVFLQSDPSEISEAQQIQYDYLCCNEEELFRTHELDEEVPMPSCTSLQDNYYVREGCYYQRFDKRADEKTQLNTEISAGKEVSVFKFSGKAAYEESREILLNNLIREGLRILQPGISSPVRGIPIRMTRCCIRSPCTGSMNKSMAE